MHDELSQLKYLVMLACMSTRSPLFSRIFDGTQVLTGVTAIPWYSREIFIP